MSKENPLNLFAVQYEITSLNIKGTAVVAATYPSEVINIMRTNSQFNSAKDMNFSKIEQLPEFYDKGIICENWN